MPRRRSPKQPEFSLRRAAAILAIAAVLCGLTAWEVISSVRPEIAQRHVERGKNHLKSAQYDAASAEFRTAERLLAGSAGDWLQLAQDAPTNPRVLTEYWREQGVTPLVARLEEATRPYDSPKDALAAAMNLHAAGHSAFAQYALDRALELDPTYPEAWHYRYLVCDAMAEFDASYRAKADAARVKRDQLTPLYLKP
jgi:tetratricopeptide (TPR) repeat protein